MARIAPIYPTYARGEVSPLMYGRVDIEPYSSCLRKCRNMWIRPFGVASRVAGTEYITTTKARARLMKFVFSPSDSYMIEVGAGYFRFINNGAYIVDGNDEIYEVANDFTWEQVESLHYVQLDDVIKIVTKDDTGHHNHPKELIRNAANDWTFRDTTFVTTPYLDENTTDVTLMASSTTGAITVSASSPIFNANHVGSYWWLGETTTVDNIKKQGFFKITGFTDSTHVSAEVKHQLSTAGATKIWGEGAWSNHRGWPSSIGLLDGRLYYARTPNSPRNVYGSQPYAYENFTPAIDNEDDGSINIELASNATGDGSDIQWIIGTNFLLVGTYGAEFVVKASGDASITPTDVTARARSNWGSEPIQPVTLGHLIHFVQRTGKKIRQFVYDYYIDDYKAVDVSLYSEHLLESPIKDVAYQKTPDSILWCLREDGKVAALTLETDQQIQAWALMEFDGKVESIETVPSYNGMYDEVYFIISRKINGQTVRHIERIQDPVTPESLPKCWYVRDGLNYNGYVLTEGNDLALSAVSGDGVTATSASAVFNAGMIGRRIRQTNENLEVVGEGTIIEYVSPTQVKINVSRRPFDTVNIDGGLWAVSVVNISDLSHLEGREVSIFADGAVQSSRTVESGSVLLELDAFYVTIGLSYQSYLLPMPLEGGSENGTSVGKRKRVNELALRVWRTSGLRCGYDLKHLQTVKFRDVETPMGEPQPLFTGIIPNVKFNGGWNWESDVVIEQQEPLPMNILAIAPMLNEVDK